MNTILMYWILVKYAGEMIAYSMPRSDSWQLFASESGLVGCVIENADPPPPPVKCFSGCLPLYTLGILLSVCSLPPFLPSSLDLKYDPSFCQFIFSANHSAAGCASPAFCRSRESRENRPEESNRQYSPSLCLPGGVGSCSAPPESIQSKPL